MMPPASIQPISDLAQAPEFPWTLETAPHGVVDINRGCNVRCQACYNTGDNSTKPLTRIVWELDRLLSLRRLQAVTISGGEPTLHPDLPEVIRAVKSRGLRAILVSNGALLSGRVLARLAEAGLDLVHQHSCIDG